MSVVLPYFSVHVIYSKPRRVVLHGAHFIILNIFPNVKGNVCVIYSTSPAVPHSLPCFWLPAYIYSLDYLLFNSHQQHGCFTTFLLLKVSNLVWLSVRLLCSLYLIVEVWKKKNDFLVCQLCHYHKYAANQGSVPETSYSIRLLTALRSDGLIFEGCLRGGYSQHGHFLTFLQHVPRLLSLILVLWSFCQFS